MKTRRTVLATLLALFMAFGFAAPAMADTWLCNATGGFVCGKVRNSPYSTASISVIDHYGNSRLLRPGQSSRDIGMRDVARVVTPTKPCTTWHFAGVLRHSCFRGGVGIEDNAEWNVFRVK